MSDPISGPMPGGRRRIDRVLAENYLAGIEQMSLAEVRVLRSEAQQEETDLSYVRRLLQGRIDIVRAELVRRGGAAEGVAGGSVVDQLPSILSAGPPGGGSARYLRTEPSRVDEHRRRVEQLLADVQLSDVTARTDGELT